ncbi:MAG: hypothetical protein A2527_01375 [Candidatus Lambdaproteobacteria bacterium RIFOXYD2_FULL_50_16]|uniref:Metallo-beta-lactamase domain-containing protein n=1 Tax=Candidatus Lambdaproteobacteria bacterium RIFOXYD2_FULL_50_16 TaxID=1817772 RepID=A0A1F6G8Q2_9PROT|nr:MAG: hypothetical protein A2527_01375 [Candidatus Lambdaproteobacteria bacterium RIFOXYD2_FULL_50_16]
MELKRHQINTPYLVGPIEIFEFWIGRSHFLVDTGPPTQEAKEYLQRNIDLENLDYLLITHCHPDHYGLAHFIEGLSPAKIVLAQVDARLYQLYDQRIAFLTKTFEGMGFPPELDQFFKSLIPKFQGDIPFPKRFSTLEEVGPELNKLGITWISCPGHSQSDMAYLIGNMAITGDILLRNIFSAPLLDMDLHRGEGRFSNYRAYCRSIPKIKTLTGKTILPSHNHYIEGIDQQLLFYVGKIIERAKKIKPLAESGQSAYQILNTLFPSFFQTPFKVYIKAGELFFITDFLAEPDLLYDALREVGLFDRLKL